MYSSFFNATLGAWLLYCASGHLRSLRSDFTVSYVMVCCDYFKKMLVTTMGTGKWGIPKDILMSMCSPERNSLRRNIAELKCLPEEDGSIPKTTPHELLLSICCCSCCPNLLILLFSFFIVLQSSWNWPFLPHCHSLEQQRRLSRLTKYRDWNSRCIF